MDFSQNFKCKDMFLSFSLDSLLSRASRDLRVEMDRGCAMVADACWLWFATFGLKYFLLIWKNWSLCFLLVKQFV